MAQGEGSPAGPQAGSREGTHLNDGSSKEKGVKAIFPCHFLRKPPLELPNVPPVLGWPGVQALRQGKASPDITASGRGP